MRGKLGEGELRLGQWHHAYLGALIIIVGGWLGLCTTYAIGSVILWDDLLQHFIQWRWDVSYQSPLKYLYGKWIWEPLHK